MADKYLLKYSPLKPQNMKFEPEFLKKKMKNERLFSKNTRFTERIDISILQKKLKVFNEQKLQEQETLQRLRFDAFQKGGFYREEEPKVIFAIRLKGINKIAPKPKKILQLLRLRQINNGVFIKANKATLEMLNKVTPFITYGYPSLKCIRHLIYKRGYGKFGKPGAYSRVRLMHNSTVSDALAKYDILGLEDLVREIHTCGPHFKEANNFLWPFKLSCPAGGWIAKRRGFCDPRNGDWGNREQHINDLVARMN